MKPPFAYYGGKAVLAPWIASLLPPHRVYVEPFAGSAAVLFAKEPATHEVVNDVNGDIVAFFRCLRDRPDELLRAVRLSPYSRDEFAQAQDGAEVDELEQARRWWVVVNQGFNKSARAKNGWSSSVECGNGEAKTLANRVDRLEEVAARLAEVTIENRDARWVIDAYGKPDACVYVDPPYFAGTRADTVSYPHEFATEDDHRALAETLHATPAAVVLSGYGGPLYDELYGDWHRLERRIVRRVSNRASGERPHVVEVLWSNRRLEVDDLFSMAEEVPA
jgi:DNA adenine methylase